MKNSHKLIISADDFGLAPSVTEGIIFGLSKGCITDTNLIATSPYSIQSILMAKQNNLNQMGIHLNLEIGNSCLDGQSLKNKRFKNDNQEYYSWVEKEFLCQCNFLVNHNLKLTHITYHKNIINNQKMATIIVKLAQLFKVPIRRTSNPKVNSYLRDADMIMPTRRITNPINQTYSLSYLQQQLSTFKDHELIEIICHPGYTSPELQKLSSLTNDRIKDLKLFTDQQTICMIRKEGYQLTNYSVFGEK